MYEKPEKANIEPLSEEQKETFRKLWILLWKMEDIKKPKNGTLNIGSDSSRFRQKPKVFGIHLVKQTKN